MSATNGTKKTSAKRRGQPQAPQAFVRPRQTAGYRPNVWYGGLANALIDGRPLFTWLDAERMRTDPEVTFGMAILRAPFYTVTWDVECKNAAVRDFVDKTLRRLWERCIRKILTGYHVYGIHAGEISHTHEGGLIQFNTIDDFSPRDVRPLQWRTGPKRGQIAGLRVRNIAAAVGDANAGCADLLPPHAWWFAGNAEYGALYGRAVLAGAFEPWEEKNGKGGAVDSRRLWFKKCAFRGGMMRYPRGFSDFGDESQQVIKFNQDVAREFMEDYENGGIGILPNDRTIGGEDYAWTFDPPGPNGEAPGILEYPDKLDKKVLKGMGIPPEIVEAATVGSGYSGRSIPAQMFFTMADETTRLVINTADPQVIKPLVMANYGPVPYAIKPHSLAALVAKEASDAGKPVSVNQSGDSGLWIPTQSGRGEKNLQTGQWRARLSDAEPAVDGDLAARVKELAALEYPDLEPIRLSDFREDKHPRDDKGQWVAKEDLRAARTDPAKAAELQQRVTNPQERAKLNAAIKPPEEKDTSERGREIGDFHETNARAILSKVRSGEYDLDDAAEDIRIYHDEAVAAERSNFLNRYALLKQSVIRNFGKESVESPEWAAVKEAHKNGYRMAAEAINGITEAVEQSISLKKKNSWEISKGDFEMVADARQKHSEAHSTATKQFSQAAAAFLAKHKRNSSDANKQAQPAT